MESLRKNVAYQTLYQTLLLLMPLVTAPYIARVLGPENSGIYSYCNTIAAYFVVFANLGIEQYGNRSIARVRDNRADLDTVFSELFVFHSLSAILCILVYGLFAFVFAIRYQNIIIIEGLYVLSSLLDINWLFFGLGQFKSTVVRNSVIKVISVVCIFLFVNNRNDLPIYTAIMAGSVLASQMALLPLARRCVSFSRIELSALGKHFTPMILLFVAVIAANINRVIDKAMLGWFGYISDLGCYDYADRIIRMPLGLIAALGTVMLSKMSNLYANKSKEAIVKILNASEIIIIIVSFASAFGLAAISPDFIALYLGEEYEQTSTLIPILAISIPLVGWNNFVRTQILIPQKKDAIYTKAVLSGALINILANLLGITMFGAYGAAVVTVISYSVITIIQTINSKEDLDIRDVLRFTPIQLGIGVIMFVCVRGVSLLNVSIVLRIILEFFVGAFIYILFTLIHLRYKHNEILQLVMRHQNKR